MHTTLRGAIIVRTRSAGVAERLCSSGLGLTRDDSGAGGGKRGRERE